MRLESKYDAVSDHVRSQYRQRPRDTGYQNKWPHSTLMMIVFITINSLLPLIEGIQVKNCEWSLFDLGVFIFCWTQQEKRETMETKDIQISGNSPPGAYEGRGGTQRNTTDTQWRPMSTRRRIWQDSDSRRMRKRRERFLWTLSMNWHVRESGTSKRHKNTCHTIMLWNLTLLPLALACSLWSLPQSERGKTKSSKVRSGSKLRN